MNLSDKELDRLSREAAQEYDPGDLIGSRSWEQLEVRLDRELGSSPSPGPLKGIRRFPFYYAPALILLLGITYFFVRNKVGNNSPSGGSPPALVHGAPSSGTSNGQPANSSTKTAEVTYSPSSTPPKENTPGAAASSTATSSASSPATLSGSASTRSAATSAALSSASSSASGTALRPGSGSASPARAAGAPPVMNPGRSSTHPATISSDQGKAAGNNGHGQLRNAAILAGVSNSGGRGAGRTLSNGSGLVASPAGSNDPGSKDPGSKGPVVANPGSNNSGGSLVGTQHAPSESRGLHRSSTPILRSPGKRDDINDSALRAFTVIGGPIHADKRSLRINQPVHLGVVVAPDFASVNSFAGNHAGSTVGITFDYQFASRWYVGTGLLISRKNYGAWAQDYHVSSSYYQMNNIHQVDFVKGTFNMLEVPLNIRYDFSVVGKTLFFVSGGVSSYFLTDESCNYYYNWFGRDECRSFQYNNQNSYPFSSINLSFGLETDLTRNISFSFAPYMKLPAGHLGFGQVNLTSIGINFALQFNPVLSRKKH